MGLTIKSVHHDFEISLLDETKIRLPPPMEVDEKTKRPKPFKPDRKDPDAKLGGVKGAATDLHSEQWAGLALARNREGKMLATRVFVFGEMPKP
jgi:hypothetical protein